jgi:arylsulfatase A-like enzyme
VKTPHIEALAQSGVRFYGEYRGAWCMLSRASILAGCHPHGIRLSGSHYVSATA